jgi:cobalt-zinc-cadmium efflux system outer membrane protein
MAGGGHTHDRLRTVTDPHSCPRSRGGRRPFPPLIAVAAALLSAVAPAGLRAQGISPVDPALVGPLRAAIERASPELAARRAEIEAAEARLRAAGLAPPAVLSGEIEDVPDGYDLPGAAVRLEVGREFLTGGRSAAARALAATDTRAAEALLRAAERRLDARIGRELMRTLAGLSIGRRLAAEDSLLVAAEAALRGRFSVGEARYVDVLRLRTERLRVQNERAEALAEARAGRLALEGLGGPTPPAGFAALVDSVLAVGLTRPLAGEIPPPPSLDSLVALAASVRLADVALERARAERDLLRAEQRPRIAASVGAQRTIGDDGGSEFGPVIGASVTLPFTARRANEASLQAAEREIAAAAARREAVLAAVRSDLAGSLARYEAARERLAVYDAALLRGAREERESALAAYRTGELSLIELLDFERALARAEIERLQAQADAAHALADLLSGAAGADPDASH